MTGHSTYATAQEIRDRIVRKEVSAIEVMAKTLSRMEALEPTLNAFVTPTSQRRWRAVRDAVTAPGSSPSLNSRSASLAASIARSDVGVTKAFSVGSSDSIRERVSAIPRSPRPLAHDPVPYLLRGCVGAVTRHGALPGAYSSRTAKALTGEPLPPFTRRGAP